MPHREPPPPPRRPAATERVEAAARELGLDIDIREFAEGTKTAADAATAVGVDVGQIVKTLVFAVDGSTTLALVSGANRLDEQKLAAAAGGGAVTRLDPDSIREATGFAIGGLPPFGFPTSIPVFVDPDLLAFDVVWAGGGTPIHLFPIAPPDLVRATSGVVGDLKAER